MLGFVFCGLAYPIRSQLAQSESQSPKELVEAFCKFETAGKRLTPDGWDKASRLFTHPTRQPQKLQILVSGNGYSVWEPNMKSPTSALVIVGVAGDIYRIDQEMRITDTSIGSKSFMGFKVVQTNNHWELQPDGKMKKVVGKPEWRIEGSGDEIWLSRDTAIRYLGELSDNSKDTVFKRKADRAIKFLKRNLD
jgi:hypothetical protein